MKKKSVYTFVSTYPNQNTSNYLSYLSYLSFLKFNNNF